MGAILVTEYNVVEVVFFRALLRWMSQPCPSMTWSRRGVKLELELEPELGLRCEPGAGAGGRGSGPGLGAACPKAFGSVTL